LIENGSDRALVLTGIAMALALKNNPDTSTSPLLDRLSVGILAGVVYVLGSVAIVSKLIPSLWWSAFAEGFSTLVLLGAVLLGAVALLSAIGIWLLGSHPAHGLKAGIFTALLALLLAVLISRGIAGLIEQWTFSGTIPPMVGMMLAGVVSLVLVVVAVGWVVRPKTHSILTAIEDQGWFSVNSYKRSQGQLVRRGTIFGLLVLIGCGVYVMIEHNTLNTASANWDINIPFTGNVTIRDPKDAATLLKEVPYQWVRVDHKGDSDLVDGKVIPRSEFEDAVKKVEEKRGKSEAKDDKSKPQLPTGLPVLGRFEYRELVQGKLTKDYVKIDKPGDEHSPFSAGQVVLKSTFDDAIKRLKEAPERDERDFPKTAKELNLPDTTTDFVPLTLLPNVKLTLPLLIAALGLWLAWRLVNMPVFADFLIATEAELNKVSWTTRRRLMQDTVVVLITVALLAVFILFTDTVWFKALSWNVIGVLQVDKNPKKSTSLTEQPW
jgi:preprotein translocase SecE subunit